MKIDKKEIEKKVRKIAKGTINSVENTSRKAKELANKSKAIATQTKDKVAEKMDANGDGQVDIEDIIVLGLKTPGIRINREEFLRKEFAKKYKKEIVDKAVATTPMQAGMKLEDINKIADEVIKFERNCVSGISAALGTPGGVAMVATIPADIIQYYGYMLRAAQKLMYLYGFPEINAIEKEHNFDTETLNTLIICLGTMYGVAGANNAIKVMAKGLAEGVGKKIMKTALTKGTIYPIVKSTAKWFGVKMSKEMLAGIAKKSIPVIGGVIGGGITFATFKPCCDKLKNTLKDTMLSNPNYEETEEVKEIFKNMEYTIKDE
ncbi:MAG: hypothetical protein IKK84_04825 [Clostridia bacterium]|nr:hypothetical protein [Clostridia bacterium]